MCDEPAPLPPPHPPPPARTAGRSGGGGGDHVLFCKMMIIGHSFTCLVYKKLQVRRLRWHIFRKTFLFHKFTLIFTSVSDPDSTGSVHLHPDSESGSRQAKMASNERKKNHVLKSLMFSLDPD